MGQTPLIFGKEISLRSVINPQLQLGELDIGSIRIDPKSRDDIPQILLGLQHIYTTPEVRQAVFGILEEMLPEKKDSEEPGKADPTRPEQRAVGHEPMANLRAGRAEPGAQCR